MNPRTMIQCTAGFLVLVGPCLGFFAYTKYEERQRVMAMSPAQLPGHVMVFSAPG